MSTPDAAAPASQFTGERPHWGKDFDYDEARHLAAYNYARTLAKDLRVLDAGSGEGFGTQTLVAAAREVVGIDYSRDAVAFSREQWKLDGLEFRVEDLTQPAGDDVDKFDLILNFQVVEHIDDPKPFLIGLKSRLTANGSLVLTTPNRLRSVSENPYHVREYTKEELAELLGTVFSRVEILGMHGNEKVEQFDAGRARAVARILALDPLRLRDRLPQGLVKWAFAKLSVVVRKAARSGSTTPIAAITPDDFEARAENVDNALDLMAICRP